MHVALYPPRMSSLRCSATNPTPYDEIRPTYLNPVKDPTSDTESIPSPSTSPVLARRHYGESITSLGKASILGKALPDRPLCRTKILQMVRIGLH